MRISSKTIKQLIKEAILNAYQVLGVSKNASPEEIKSAWKKLAIQNHPDKGGDTGRMVDINKAYEILKVPNPTKVDYQSYIPAGQSNSTSTKEQEPSKSNSKYDNSWYNWSSKQQQYREKPSSDKCPWCGREISYMKINSDRFLNHYTRKGGTIKCSGSGRSIFDFKNWDNKYSPPPPPNDHKEQENYTKYFVNTTAGSNKFWEITVTNLKVVVRWGKIGSAGIKKTYDFKTVGASKSFAAALVGSKIAKGYVIAKRPDPTQSGSSSKTSAPPPPKYNTNSTSSNKKTKDVYKVYPFSGARRVVRVNTKLYGTEKGGVLKTGSITKFKPNDRVKVSASSDLKKMKINSLDSDYSQEWSSMEEARRAIDELVIDIISEIAEK